MDNIRRIYLKIFIFLVEKISVYLNRHVFVMKQKLTSDCVYAQVDRSPRTAHLQSYRTC